MPLIYRISLSGSTFTANPVNVDKSHSRQLNEYDTRQEAETAASWLTWKYQRDQQNDKESAERADKKGSSIL